MVVPQMKVCVRLLINSMGFEAYTTSFLIGAGGSSNR